MLVTHVALVSESQSVDLSEVSKVAAALQKQAVRDLGPIWNLQATVAAFAQLEDVPVDYWPIIVMDDINVPGAAGVHQDKDGQPFALVQNSNQWSLTASHELLEMLVDPFGNRLVAGQSIKPDQGRVNYLVEVSDPSEDEEFAYRINGILVSDFYTPRFFDPIAAPGVRYSFTGAIDAPRKVLKNGYVSWHEPISDHWWQATFFGPTLEFRDLGIFTANVRSLREEVDKRSFRSLDAGKLVTSKLQVLTQAGKPMRDATSARAESLRSQIKAVVDSAKLSRV